MPYVIPEVFAAHTVFGVPIPSGLVVAFEAQVASAISFASGPPAAFVDPTVSAILLVFATASVGSATATFAVPAVVFDTPAVFVSRFPSAPPTASAFRVASSHTPVFRTPVSAPPASGIATFNKVVSGTPTPLAASGILFRGVRQTP